MNNTQFETMMAEIKAMRRLLKEVLAERSGVDVPAEVRTPGGAIARGFAPLDDGMRAPIAPRRGKARGK